MKNLLLLLLLSTIVLNLSTPAQAATESWGGPHIAIEINNNTAQFQFDCASGTAENTWIAYREGYVNAHGIFTQGSGVRMPPGHEPTSVEVQYKASIRGDSMTLQVESRDGTLKAAYQLKKNEKAELQRCM